MSMFGTKVYSRIFFEGDTGGAGGGGTPPPAFVDQIKDEGLKGWVKSQKIDTADNLATAYRELQKFTGVPADQLLKLPPNMDSPEGAAVFQRLGKPEKPDGYNFGLDDKATQDQKDFAAWAGENFHKANLTAKQAEALSKAFNDRQIGQNNTLQEQNKAKFAQEEAELKTAWGSAHDRNTQVAANAAKKFGLDAASLDAIQKSLGYKKGMEFLKSVGDGLGEANFHAGDKGGEGNLDANTAKSKHAALMADKNFTDRYFKGDKAAIAEIQKLAAQAFPG